MVAIGTGLHVCASVCGSKVAGNADRMYEI